MIDTWNPAKLNEKISGRDSWNPAILNEAVTDRDSWNPSILNESAGDTPVEFEATITASFPEGATCTATDGTTTLTADDNPMAFDIPNEGTWTVACVANGITFSENVVITTNGQTETVNLIPSGETVTPTDSVPVLIACAGIGDSEITTIAGALADVETLAAILESENAIDYLVRSTTFASDVTSDSVAMEGIGAINYDANTLLADSTWFAAIVSSDYFDKVLNLQIPTMTSDTQPEGVASASSNSSDAYKTMDKSNDTDWSATGLTGQWVMYNFGSPVLIWKAMLLPKYATQGRVKDFKLRASNNGEDWTDLYTGTALNQDYSENPILIDLSSNITAYQYYMIYVSNEYGTGNLYIRITEFNVYGREDVE